MNIEPNQVWAGKSNPDTQRIILQADQKEKRVLYIEYWKSQDKMFREGVCSMTQLCSWGMRIEDMVEKSLLNRALDFLVSDRFDRTQLMLKDLSSVLMNLQDRQEVLAMLSRIEQMSSSN